MGWFTYCDSLIGGTTGSYVPTVTSEGIYAAVAQEDEGLVPWIPALNAWSEQTYGIRVADEMLYLWRLGQIQYPSQLDECAGALLAEAGGISIYSVICDNFQVVDERADGLRGDLSEDLGALKSIESFIPWLQGVLPEIVVDFYAPRIERFNSELLACIGTVREFVALYCPQLHAGQSTFQRREFDQRLARNGFTLEAEMLEVFQARSAQSLSVDSGTIEISYGLGEDGEGVARFWQVGVTLDMGSLHDRNYSALHELQDGDYCYYMQSEYALVISLAKDPKRDWPWLVADLLTDGNSSWIRRANSNTLEVSTLGMNKPNRDLIKASLRSYTSKRLRHVGAS